VILFTGFVRTYAMENIKMMQMQIIL